MKQGSPKLQPEERVTLFRMHQLGYRNADIARELGRHRCSIGRELERNTQSSGEYLPEAAGRKANARRYRRHRCERDPELAAYVEDRLEWGWSPEQIAGRRRLEGHTHVLSHEAVYQYIYDTPRGRSAKLHKRLCRGKARRGYRGPKRPRGSRIPNMRSIHERPEPANERQEFGHYEADSMDFRNQKRPLLTLTERKTRFTQAAERLDRTADAATEAQIRLLAGLPPQARRSITYDQGSEFAGHERVAESLGLTTYFCDPHAPWQRGAIENTNGWLRRDLPRKVPLEQYSADDLDDVLWLHNTTPRKCLGYRTPLEAFNDELTAVAVACARRTPDAWDW
ncbi:MAG: IS30 family transposase [Thiohalorhabdaceae bacterium]